jgi:hypothetical protein
MRLTLLVLLLGCVACTQAGCLFLPIPAGSAKPGLGREFRTLVGPANSDRPIRPGFATQESIRALLGEPTEIQSPATSPMTTQPAWLQWVYVVNVPTKRWIILLPMKTETGMLWPGDSDVVCTTFYLTLAFEPSGVLRRYLIEEER